MARSLPDSTIGDNRALLIDALRAVQGLQFFEALERSVLIAGLPPGHIARARNMAASLASLRQARRRQDFPRKFLRTSDINHRRLALLQGFENLRQEGSPRQSRLARFV